MKIRIYSLLLCGFALGSLSALAQQSPLLEKYLTMALDYNPEQPTFSIRRIRWN